MRTIAIEEHFSAAKSPAGAASAPIMGAVGQYMAEVGKRLADLGEGRLSDMDAAGIDMQVLSLSAVDNSVGPDAASASDRARSSNDALAEAIHRHPGCMPVRLARVAGSGRRRRRARTLVSSPDWWEP